MPTVDFFTYEATMSLVREYVARNPIPQEMLADLISSVSTAVKNIAREAIAMPATPFQPAAPAVPVAASVTQKYIICLEDGSRHAMMKRFLMRKFGLTPDEYRNKWGLPKDYPMTAPGYSELKRCEAHNVGLGTAANKRGYRGRHAG